VSTRSVSSNANRQTASSRPRCRRVASRPGRGRKRSPAAAPCRPTRACACLTKTPSAVRTVDRLAQARAHDGPSSVAEAHPDRPRPSAFDGDWPPYKRPSRSERLPDRARNGPEMDPRRDRDRGRASQRSTCTASSRSLRPERPSGCSPMSKWPGKRKAPAGKCWRGLRKNWLRGQDLNLGPSGYEPHPGARADGRHITDLR